MKRQISVNAMLPGIDGSSQANDRTSKAEEGGRAMTPYIGTACLPGSSPAAQSVWPELNMLVAVHR